ncbi:hypothetical protein [Actinomadura mexicana]|uniref:Uncharacterized protein n=1 Tax=Actinomadura mexicana TaxID=134959 RepID=A0A239BVL4_9ACTN|nr:hypothetical protein [Actinomadura mexicana]SNS11468.1 hypothetical protein SAMN06265355_111110 [Actinomadura mexicana]
MARQISHGSSVPALEHRVAVLERQVAALAEAARLLAAAVESTSPDTPDPGEPAPPAHGGRRNCSCSHR